MYNKIANYVLIQQEINIHISDDAPCEYMAKVIEQCHGQGGSHGGIKDENALKENLKQNCIPEDFVSMAIDDYEKFLTKRRKLMAEKIRHYYENL